MNNVIIKSIEQKATNEVTKANQAALEWHDFICWMESEKGIPCSDYLKEYQNEDEPMCPHCKNSLKGFGECADGRCYEC